MAQNDIQITTTPPLAGLTLVQGVNGALQSLATDFAGAVDPAAIGGVGPYCTWADTANALLKRRNAANTAWVVEGELFQQAARRNGDPTQDFSAKNVSASSMNGGQLAGMRNKIINGALQINQRSYVSGAATTAGQYTLDRWRTTSTGGITFATTGNKTTVTIPAGQTIQQVIEGLNLQSGDYVLSWEGSAQGRIGAGAYGNSGEVTATIVGGTNTTIEFGEGTVSNAQLELGTVATPFEHRPYGAELALCQRYFQIFKISVSGPAYVGRHASVVLPVQMRTSPTVVRTANWFTAAEVDSLASLVDNSTVAVSNPTSTTAVGGIFTANAEIPI